MIEEAEGGIHHVMSGWSDKAVSFFTSATTPTANF